jgi:hypothetical protein
MLLLLDILISTDEEEESEEGTDRKDRDGMLLQTGVDGWTFTPMAAQWG